MVPVEAAQEWIAALLDLPELTQDAALAIVQLGARTTDAERDIHEALRERAITRLIQSGHAEEMIKSLRTYVAPARADAMRIFGESLPEGLRLVI